MTNSKHFSFILHIISNNEHITDVVISGIACRSTDPAGRIERFTYSITQIILDSEDITDIASHLDMQQINSACFNYAQTVFSDDQEVAGNLWDPVLPLIPLGTAMAN